MISCIHFIRHGITEGIQNRWYYGSTDMPLVEEGVKVLTSADRWYGVTYAADKPVVMDALHAMQEAGLYPDGLWG